MNKSIISGILASVVLMVILFIINLILTAKKGRSSLPVTRGIYLSGIAAAILNILRVIHIYEGSRGSMLTANFIVLACLIIGFFRQGKEQE